MGWVAESIALASNGDNVGLVEETVENRGGGWHASQQLAPVVHGTLRGHYGTACFIATHHDLEEEFSTSLGELLHPEVVDD